MKMLKRLSVLFFVLICVFSISAVSASANESVSDISDELTTDYEPGQTEETSPFFINADEVFVYEQNGAKFELFSVSLTVDFNGDSKCTAVEAREMLRIAAGLVAFDGNVESVDVSQDGKLSAVDARLLLRYSARLDAHFSDKNGDCPTGFVVNSDGKTCYFDENGILSSGLKTIDNILYYFGSDGVMSTGIVKISGNTYYFDENGKAVSGEKTIDGKKYQFENGKAKTGLVKDGDWYYFYGNDGAMQTGLIEVNGQKYLFGDDGKGSVYIEKHEPSDFNTAMIGDSLVATIGLYNVTDYIDFYGKVSLNSYSIFNKSISGSSRYVIDEVTDRGYDKVIILMGINELGYDTSTWVGQYKKIVDGVKQRAPGADIYIHAILPVHESRASNKGYSVTNSAINSKNAALKQLAENEGVYFIDAREAIALSDGTLPYEAASDGIHLNYSYCKIWSDWLLEQICK